jgi:hypothetical protein
MDVKNLAIIVAPSVMPVEERIVVSGTSRLNHHVQVIEVRTQMCYCLRITYFCY